VGGSFRGLVRVSREGGYLPRSSQILERDNSEGDFVNLEKRKTRGETEKL